jgi:hypothetical protein
MMNKKPAMTAKAKIRNPETWEREVTKVQHWFPAPPLHDNKPGQADGGSHEPAEDHRVCPPHG